MDALSEMADDLRDSIQGSNLFQLVHRRKRGHANNFGRNAQVGQFVRDRENANQGELLYTEHIPTRLPQNKNSKRDAQAIQKFLDRDRALLFDRYPNLRTTDIRIQSPFLRAELRTILDGYDLDFDDEEGVIISAPFEPLFFTRHAIWRRFKQLQDLMGENTEDENTELTENYTHMKLLIDDVLNDAMADLIEEADSLRQEKKITYYLLWTLFPYRSIVVANDSAGYQQAYQVEKFEYVSMTDESRVPVMFDMTCQYVHFDAYRFGFLNKALTIGHFAGKKDLKDLDITPLESMPRSKELRKMMILRGKKMLLYQGVQHVQIKPAQFDISRQNYDELLRDLGRAETHGRAIVDFFTGARRNDRWRQVVKPLENSLPSKESKSESTKGKGKGRAEEFGDSQSINSASYVAGLGKPSDRAATKEELDSRKRPSNAIQEENVRLVELDDVNCLLMCPLLHAFSLQSKKWISVNVDSIAPVAFHSQAFDHLVADDKYKSRLLSLVKSQLLISDPFISDDPIPEKGRGLLVLLSGPPGTGKTLMAESIAEKAERPLYYVDARDLGTSIAEIAANFSIIMENAREWNAVVLLDEADIYLQTRHTANGGSRSSDRTTAFLRQLEYFQGILFLTTNLPQTIDPAIESRIHISLPFPALTQPFRVTIWQHFLACIPGNLKSLSQADIRELGQWNINGRQIKNAFRMCGAYCNQERKKISLEDLEDMIGMTCPSAVKESQDPAVGEGDHSMDNDEIQLGIEPTTEPETTNQSKGYPGNSPEGSMAANSSGSLLPISHRLEQTNNSPASLSAKRKRPPPIPIKRPNLISKDTGS